MPQNVQSAVMVLQHQEGDVVIVSLFRQHQPPASATATFSSEDSQSLLRVLQTTLSSQQCSFQDLTGVVVVAGTARFTVNRLVAVIANAVAWSVHCPVVQTARMPHHADEAFQLVQTGTLGTPIVPQYSKDPRINT